MHGARLTGAHGARLVGASAATGRRPYVTADDPRQVEIGFTVAPAHQGRGFATEAVLGILAYLFECVHKHRVFASVDPRNVASMALLKRVGMRQEAHYRESLWFKGGWADDVVFGILESEWASR